MANRYQEPTANAESGRVRISYSAEIPDPYSGYPCLVRRAFDLSPDEAQTLGRSVLAQAVFAEEQQQETRDRRIKELEKELARLKGA